LFLAFVSWRDLQWMREWCCCRAQAVKTNNNAKAPSSGAAAPVGAKSQHGTVTVSAASSHQLPWLSQSVRVPLPAGEDKKRLTVKLSQRQLSRSQNRRAAANRDEPSASPPSSSRAPRIVVQSPTGPLCEMTDEVLPGAVREEPTPLTVRAERVDPPGSESPLTPRLDAELEAGAAVDGSAAATSSAPMTPSVLS
jgi:hypothetical protein